MIRIEYFDVFMDAINKHRLFAIVFYDDEPVGNWRYDDDAREWIEISCPSFYRNFLEKQGAKLVDNPPVTLPAELICDY
jgi:hypothetical protein